MPSPKGQAAGASLRSAGSIRSTHLPRGVVSRSVAAHMDELRKIWGKRVAVAREASGLSQFALAVKAGVSQSAISAIEQGTRGGRHELRLAIAAALGADVNELFAYPAESAA